MIKSITFQNFFSFSKETIELSDLNVIVGINGSGKSNFTKAIKLLKAITTEGKLRSLVIDEWGGFDAMCFLGIDIDSPIQIEYKFDHEVISRYGYKFTQPIIYRIRFHNLNTTQNFYICESFHTEGNDNSSYIYMKFDQGSGIAREQIGDTKGKQESVKYIFDNSNESAINQIIDKDRYPQIHTLREALKDITVYDYFNTTPNSSIRKPSMPDGSNRLKSDGANLPQILNYIKISNKSDYNKIAESLSTINPNINGFDFNILGTNIELMLDESKLNKSIHVTHISDGTLRFLCLLAIIHNSRRGCLICIDELEVGLHPDMINEILSSIKDSLPHTQYILPTHSSMALDQVSIDKLIVFEKSDINSTIAKRFTDKKLIEWANGYSTGNLWRDGDLGGNRY